ncbi:ATP-grasp domain-containing protein [Kaarinaea lacus]
MLGVRRGWWRLCIASPPITRRSYPQNPVVKKPSGTKPRLLLVAPPDSYRIAAYLKAAQSLDVELQIASRGEHSLVNEIAAGVHINLDNEQQALDKILSIARQKPYQSIIAPDDYTVELAAKIAQALDLPHNPPAAARFSRRKDLARERLHQNHIPTPQFRRIDLKKDLTTQISGFPFPCVVKPVSLSGSRGVIRVNNAIEFIEACARIKKIVSMLSHEDEKNFLLVEEYIPGNEVAVEGFLKDSEFIPLALFDKPDPLEGPFFEETYYITPSRLSLEHQQHIFQQVHAACKAYGLRTGPVHAELRLHDNQAWIIEVAARTIGGECAQLLKFGTGYSLEQLVIAHSIGLDITMQPMEEAAGVLMIPTPKPGILRRVEGVLAAQKIPLIESVIISVREGYELQTLPEGSSYLGFIFARGPNPQKVETALRQAHSLLNIVVNPLWKLEAV